MNFTSVEAIIVSIPTTPIKSKFFGVIKVIFLCILILKPIPSLATIFEANTNAYLHILDSIFLFSTHFTLSENITFFLLSY